MWLVISGSCVVIGLVILSLGGWGLVNFSIPMFIWVATLTIINTQIFQAELYKEKKD